LTLEFPINSFPLECYPENDTSVRQITAPNLFKYLRNI